MNKEGLAKLFYREVEKIGEHPEWGRAARIKALYRLLSLLFVEVTRAERFHFSTLFARIAYAGHKYGLDKRLQFYVHQFRRYAAELREDTPDEEVPPSSYELGVKVLVDSIREVLGVAPAATFRLAVPAAWPVPVAPVEIQGFRPRVRAVALEDDPAARQLLVRDEAHPRELVRVQYGLPERNENFNPTIDLIRQVFGLPVTLNLLDVEIDTAGVYRPRAIVVEPDYLIDVSAVAECFKPDGAEPWLYLLKKFLPFPVTNYLLLGNIANFFLDELLGNSEATFDELFPRVFQLNPLAFCLFSDQEIREIMQQARGHFLNLKRTILQVFPEEGIDPRHSYLEPSFYSETYGLQGRLDLWHHSPAKSAIVELKSGKPFMPNQFGLSNNHFTQTLLYDLLIQSVFGREANPVNYILYSSQNDKTLRFAPRVRAQQYEALQVRNQLLAIEYLLAALGRPGEDLLRQGRRLLGRLHPRHFPGAQGFFQRELADFAEVFGGLDELEQKYVTAFSGFIAREHQLAKTGEQGRDNVNGQASLWLNQLGDKQEGYDIISHLRVHAHSVQENDPLIVFERTDDSNELANFRPGDIAVLYPYEGQERAVLGNQIFKCTVIELTPESVTVRLRSRQFNDELFRTVALWNLEPDLYDSGFNALYRGLFDFAAAPRERRDLLLGRRPPRENTLPDLPAPAELTDEQRHIFRQILAADDYFLLWGPPGTGKTSVMLRRLVEYLLNHTEENLLLLAYTNRAVDEICESIEAIGEHMRDTYLRIGSRYSTGQAYRDQLLNAKMERARSRQELRDILDRHRIVVATVASVSGKAELLELKRFDRVIVDEASQILEPLLVGLLPRFARFVLIGDHKQLPAVVTQDVAASAVHDEDLHGIGLGNLRNSLFERLFRRAIEHGWRHAYAQLSHQGRMHRDIMAFPSRFFYENTLRILPETTVFHQRQVTALDLRPTGEGSALERRLTARRVLFLPTPADDAGATRKTNRHEAELVGEIVDAFRRLYAAGNRPFHAAAVGIITPYRAQIAQIRQVLERRGIDLEGLTIDTVERYQGGARDIIIISLCTNSLGQLASLVSLSDEGVDRKLNVALTRAREHLVILGNPDLLSTNPVYAELIRHAEPETAPAPDAEASLEKK